MRNVGQVCRIAQNANALELDEACATVFGLNLQNCFVHGIIEVDPIDTI